MSSSLPIPPSRAKLPDAEKITINLGHVDLGRIDLLVQEGFYSNRTDFIRSAIRSQLASHAGELARTIERHTLELGLRDYSAADLEGLELGGRGSRIGRGGMQTKVQAALMASEAVT